MIVGEILKESYVLQTTIHAVERLRSTSVGLQIAGQIWIRVYEDFSADAYPFELRAKEKTKSNTEQLIYCFLLSSTDIRKNSGTSGGQRE